MITNTKRAPSESNEMNCLAYSSQFAGIEGTQVPLHVLSFALALLFESMLQLVFRHLRAGCRLL